MDLMYGAGESDDLDDSTASSSSLSSYTSDDDEELTWVQWYCRQRGNEFLCEVEDSYIQDGFNLTGLASQVPYYEHALDAVLEIESPGADNLTDQQQEIVDSAAELLYGLIHARYILTSRGLHAMKNKFINKHFGSCPRVLCRSQAVLPVGRSDIACQDGVYLYCPKCGDIYVPKSYRTASLDGAYFGRTFPHLFLMVYSNVVPTGAVETYIPRIYGFRVTDQSALTAGAGPGAGAGASAQSRPGARPATAAPGAAAAGAAGAAGVPQEEEGEGREDLGDPKRAQTAPSSKV